MLLRLALGCVGVAFAALAGAAAAATSDVSPAGFISTFREEVKATPEATWSAIQQLPRWWSGEHTYSGQASNLTLEPRAGGCWCERWGDGASVQHGTVILVQPGSVLRISAALGPLQELAVNGVLTLATGVNDGKTVLRLTYRVSGNPTANLDRLAPAVDQVLGAQYQRLKALAEAGAAR